MILLISSALISIAISSITRSHLVRAEPVFDQLQLLPYRSVVNGVSNPRNHSSDELRANPKFQENSFASQAFQLLSQSDLDITVDLKRGCHLGLNHSEMLIEGFLKGLADFAEVTDPMVVNQNENKIARLFAKRKSPQQFVCCRSFLRERDGGIDVEELEFAVPVQEFIKLTEFLADALVLTQLETDLRERFAVSFCNDCQSFDLSLAPGLLEL
jgi:hypothetical protein